MIVKKSQEVTVLSLTEANFYQVLAGARNVTIDFKRAVKRSLRMSPLNESFKSILVGGAFTLQHLSHSG